jgi:hypothetical protein
MRPHASLGALLTLAACGTPSAPPVASDAPAEPRTWLGRVARGPGAGLPDGCPLCAKTQAVAEWNREAARLEAGAAALSILREAGADLAAQVAEAMAELAALRAAAPGADEDRVAGNRWHLPAVPVLAAARPRMSEDARRWTDSLPPDGIPVVIPSLVERMRQADGAENERRQHVLLLAIAGIAPTEPPAEMPPSAGAAPTPSTSAPPALTPTPDAPPARRPTPMSSVPNVYPPQASAPAPEMPAPDGRTKAPAPDRTASPQPLP